MNFINNGNIELRCNVAFICILIKGLGSFLLVIGKGFASVLCILSTILGEFDLVFKFIIIRVNQFRILSISQVIIASNTVF